MMLNTLSAAAGVTSLTSISEQEFSLFSKLVHQRTGIRLGAEKKALLCGRLSKRLKARGVAGFGDYYQLVRQDGEKAELQTALDLITTNETYFFREPRHFELLRSLAANATKKPFRVWSAASSSGEEPYSAAMVLADTLGLSGWELFASDFSTRVLDTALAGNYPMARAQHIPQDYLKRFCLKGVGQNEGRLLIQRELRERVRFRQLNLIEPLPEQGRFDLIFLRNVLIYFDMPTKARVVRQLADTLVPGGVLVVGLSESLNGLDVGLDTIAPSMYRKGAR